MLGLEVLVVELGGMSSCPFVFVGMHLGPIDRLSPSPVTSLKISALDHEPGNDAVEGGALIPKVLGKGLAVGLLHTE